MLGAEMLNWLATGACQTANLGSLLVQPGDAEASSSTVMNLMLNLPVSLFLILSAPCIFFAAIEVADWLEDKSSIEY